MKTDDPAAAFLAEFRSHGPCAESYAYARRRRFTSFGDFWARCDRGTWMLFLAGELGQTFDPWMLATFACECAERALPLFERYSADGRPRAAIAGARAWLAGAPAAVSLGTEAAGAADLAAGAGRSEAAYAAYATLGAATAAADAALALMGAIEAAAASAAAVGRIPLGVGNWAAPALDGPSTFGDESARAWLAEQAWQAERLRALSAPINAKLAAALGLHG